MHIEYKRAKKQTRIFTTLLLTEANPTQQPALQP